MARAARRSGKPVVALKVGTSAEARAATVSHTASLAGSAVGGQALLDRLGIGRAGSLAVLLESLKLLHVAGPLASERIASMSCSGGEASLMADAVAASGLRLPALVPEQAAPLRAALGDAVALANPLDYHTRIWRDEDAMTATFSAMLRGDVALGCVVLDMPRADRCDPAAWTPVLHAAARAMAETGRPLAILSSLKETLPEDVAQHLMGAGLVALAGLDDGLAAVRIAADIGRAQRAEAALPVLVPDAAQDGHMLHEAQAKTTLRGFGIDVPGSAGAGDPMTAAETAEALGYPVVLKGEGVAHKTEAGAVVLGLVDRAAVFAAATAMGRDSYLVEAMIADGVAELLIGVVADPVHGYVLTIGAGGVLAELMDDTVWLLVPARREEVADAIRGLKIAALLAGFRGRPAADRTTILNTVMALQDFVAQTRPQEVEINPLICTPTRAVAADALIRTGA